MYTPKINIFSFLFSSKKTTSNSDVKKIEKAPFQEKTPNTKENLTSDNQDTENSTKETHLYYLPVHLM